MHIFFTSPGYPTLKTIDFIFVDQLCRAIAEQGVKVTIIAPQSWTKSIIRRVPLVSQRSIIPLNNGYNITLFRPLYLTFGNFKWFKKFNNRNFNQSIKHILNKINERPDVCYGHFWEAAYSLYPFAKKYNIPLFVSSGEELITFHKNYSIDELKNFIGYVNGVISVSTKNKDEIIKAGLAKNDSCNIIPNAIEPTLFHKKNKGVLRKQFGYNEEDFIVAFVGQFTERKGAMRLSNALNSLNDSSIKAIFMGKGNESPDYQEILFKGTVPHNLLPNYLNCADIFVLPSSNEGCSNAIIEAMACGLPIISSNLSFNHDILNEDNAILVDPYDIATIAKAIKFLKDNPEKRSLMSRNAIKTSMELTLHKRAQKILNFIQTRINK